MVHEKGNILLKNRKDLFYSQGFCVFSAEDWQQLGVDLVALADYAISKLQGVGTSSLSRSTAVAHCRDGAVSFYSKGACPVRNPLIVEDYDDYLANLAPISNMIQLLRQIALPSVMDNPQLRISVEIISRTHASTSDLPPHQDGHDYLFLLCLQNSMLGGDMELFRSKGNQSSPLDWKHQNPIFHPRNDVELCVTLVPSCGEGYFVCEKSGDHLNQILHGCRAWSQPEADAGIRTMLRIAFSTP